MAILERINHQIAGSFSDLKKFFLKNEAVTVAKHLDEQLVLFFQKATSREEAIEQLVALLDAAGKLKDRRAFHQAILERERLVSTGIGLGCAIPHAKLSDYDAFFIAVGIQSHGGIEWNALDGAPVRLIFMIGGPENKQTEYLKMLSHLTMAIKSEERRKQLLKAVDPADVVGLFTGC